MFWGLPVLDYAILLFALIVFICRAREISQIHLTLADAFLVSMYFILTITVIGDPSGLYIYVKMISALLVYALGRIPSFSFDEAAKALLIGSAIALVTNLAFLVAGMGFQVWGSSNTYSGVYYFKTDLACAMGFCASTSLFYADNRKLAWVAFALASLLVLLSNARAYYFVVFLILILYLMYVANVKLGLKTALVLLASIAGLLLVLRCLSTTNLFVSNNFLSFKFDSIADLFNGANTQGRNVIWAILMDRLADSGVIHQLFGLSITGDLVEINGGIYGSHSLYVGLLFNTGIVGLTLFALFIAFVIRKISTIPSRKQQYFAWALLVQLLVSGISVHSLQYTQNSWFVFLFLGMSLTLATSHSAGISQDRERPPSALPDVDTDADNPICDSDVNDG